MNFPSTGVPGAAADARLVLLEGSRAIAAVLRREADQAERDSRLTQAAAQALRDAGLFRLGVPRRFGGYEASPATCLDVTAEVGQACPSGAWIVAITYAAQVLAASFGERACHDMWAEGADSPMCGVFGGAGVTAERADGGLLVSGAWSWASGCYQAKWALISVPLPATDGAQPDQGLALVPVSDLTIKDTWDMAGMREVFRMTMETVESGKPLTASVYRSLADSPSVQAALANAATLIDSAHLHLARSAEFVGAEAEAGSTPGLVERARARMDVGYASTCLCEAVQLLLTVNGAGSFARANVFQRYWRDLETAARHPSLNPELAKEMYGRALVDNQQPVSHML